MYLCTCVCKCPEWERKRELERIWPLNRVNCFCFALRDERTEVQYTHYIIHVDKIFTVVLWRRRLARWPIEQWRTTFSYDFFFFIIILFFYCSWSIELGPQIVDERIFIIHAHTRARVQEKAFKIINSKRPNIFGMLSGSWPTEVVICWIFSIETTFLTYYIRYKKK